MATTIRPIGHEERLSLVDHLEELRTRLIVSGVTLAIVFAVCFWQNHALLQFINSPLNKQTQEQVERFEGPLGQTWLAQKSVREVTHETESITRALSAPSSGLSAATRAQLARAIPRLQADVAKIPKKAPGNDPVTLGVGEPLTATLTVALYFALVLSLPVILFELYGFVLPAFSPRERRLVMPLLFAVPFLFAAGVAFGYYVALPAAVHFLQNFNASQFNVLVQANQYYKFVLTILLAMGLSFQAPIVIVGAVRAGLVTPRQLRHHRRYAILGCAVIAALLPGDAFTMVLEAVPLYLLYEASILVASVVARRDAAQATATGAGRPPRDDDPPSRPGAAGGAGPLTPEPGAGPSDRRPETSGTDESRPTVQELIDHIDPELSN
jgi:sec-independent protein translocase protein TatC